MVHPLPRVGDEDLPRPQGARSAQGMGVVESGLDEVRRGGRKGAEGKVERLGSPDHFADWSEWEDPEGRKDSGFYCTRRTYSDFKMKAELLYEDH